MQETQEMQVQSLGQQDPLEEGIQYSCLENSMERGRLEAIAHGVEKSWTRLSD